MTPLALETDETLLILKIVFLALLYAFILLIVRTATRDLAGAPQDSIVLGAAEAEALRAQAGLEPARFRVVAGPALPEGGTLEIVSSAVVGRDSTSSIRLDDDEFASARHARIETRLDGVWVRDLGSTNGTFVNGDALADERRLEPGDVVRIGQTELRLER